ncbi:MAG: two-CW domain-containing protein [Thermodesulfovibrionales bacterium]
MKKNCWEIMNCGRQFGGENAEELGVCPAANYAKLDSAHGGKNAGRVCWVVAGTMCGGEIQGSFAKKYIDCRKCEFYQTVKEEEGSNFLITIDLIEWLK